MKIQIFYLKNAIYNELSQSVKKFMNRKLLNQVKKNNDEDKKI